MTGPLDSSARWLAAVQAWPWLTTWQTLLRRFREDRLALTAVPHLHHHHPVPLVTVMLALFSAFPMFAAARSLQSY